VPSVPLAAKAAAVVGLNTSKFPPGDPAAGVAGGLGLAGSLPACWTRAALGGCCPVANASATGKAPGGGGNGGGGTWPGRG
jgi:hypothetical protein